MHGARLTKRTSARVENARPRRQARLRDVDDIKERKVSWITRQHEAAVYAPGGEHQAGTDEPLQDLRDEQIRGQGFLRDLALGCQTVARATQVDNAAYGVVDLPKEVHCGPIMHREERGDEQLLAGNLCPSLLPAPGCSPATTMRQRHALAGNRESSD